jgi:hypothetical protein
VKQFVNTFPDRFLRQEIHASDEREVFTPCEIVKEREIFGDDADHALGLKRLTRIEHVVAEDENLAAGCGEQSRKHFDCRGFPGAVRPEKTVKGSAFDGKIHAVNGAELIEEPRELPGFYRQGHKQTVTTANRGIRSRVWVGFFGFGVSVGFTEPVRPGLRAGHDSGDVRIFSGGIAGAFTLFVLQPARLFLFLPCLLCLFPCALVSCCAPVFWHRLSLPALPAASSPAAAITAATTTATTESAFTRSLRTGFIDGYRTTAHVGSIKF